MLHFVYLSSIFVLLCYIVVLKRFKPGKKSTMGGWLSYVYWGGNPDVVNPISGLSKREVHVIQRSWVPATADPLASGSELLRRLFTTHPHTKEYFKMVRNLPQDEYSTNPQFKAHVINLMTSITVAVENMNQPELVVAMMEKLGESHGKRHIKEQDFHDLKGVVATMFTEVLKMDAITLALWVRTLDFWYKHLLPARQASDESSR